VGVWGQRPQEEVLLFHTADPEDVKAGRITDVYFTRTMQVIRAKGADKRVRAEFIAKALPHNWEWAVLAGVEEVAELLKGLDVTVRSMAEGTIFYPYQPVLEIDGSYAAFGIYETAVLGLICQASGIATKAARCKKLAGTRQVISFGARRMHPILAPMIERNAFIGGCDGVSVIKSAELIEAEPMGTMPHSLVIMFGDTVEATRAFDEVIEKGVRRTSLIDTFNDEKFEAVRVAEAMGEKLFAVRLDTPSSRRGNFYRILEEVRWELDLRGYRHVKLFVSGGITEEDILRLNPLVDAYGIGTSISNAPVVDFAMDIVEVEGKPLAKRGKWSGSKSVLRCGSCGKDVITPRTDAPGVCSCGGHMADILAPFIEDGRVTAELPSPKVLREKVIESLGRLPDIIL
jgi:nicotinate phosphoribosyltransferase